MPCISHYPRCCAHSAMNQVYKKVPQKGTFWHPPGVVSLQKGELAWLPAKLISLSARLTETRRRFAGSGSLIMLLRWRLLYGCAIIVPWLRRLPRALFCWHGADYHGSSAVALFVPGSCVFSTATRWTRWRNITSMVNQSL